MQNLKNKKTISDYSDLISKVLSKEGSLLISPKDASRLLSCGESTLARHRAKGIGVPYCKIGKSIRYNIFDIIKYTEDKRITK